MLRFIGLSSNLDAKSATATVASYRTNWSQYKKNIGELSFYNDQASTNKVDTSVFVDGLEHNKIVFINGRIEKIDFEYEKKDQIEIIDQSETINEFIPN